MLNAIRNFFTSFKTTNKAVKAAVGEQGAVKAKPSTKVVDQTIVVNRKAPSPFMQAVYPMHSALRSIKRRFKLVQLKAFVGFVELQTKGEFRLLVKQTMQHLGYQVARQSGQQGFIVERNNQRIYVLSLANAGSLTNIMVRPAGVSDCKHVTQMMQQHQCDAGMLITAGKITDVAFDYCSKNKIYALNGLGLLRLASDAGLVDVASVHTQLAQAEHAA